MQRRFSFQTWAIGLLVFCVPPLLLGLTSLFSHVSQMLVFPSPTDPNSPVTRAQADVDGWNNHLNDLPRRRAVTARGKKKLALIVLGRQGTQLSETLTSGAVFSRWASEWEWATVAPTLEWVMTTGNLLAFPDFTFQDAPNADVLIFPGSLDYKDPQVHAWIKARWATTPEIIIFSEGARVVAPSGMLDQVEVLPHPMVLKELRKLHKAVLWKEAPEVVHHHGKVWSGTGLASTLVGLATWAQSHNLIWPTEFAAAVTPGSNVLPPVDIRRSDLARIFLESGFEWKRPIVGLFVPQSTPELPLAFWLDSIPRTLRLRVLPFASTSVVVTKNGFRLLPLGGILADVPPPELSSWIVLAGNTPPPAALTSVPMRNLSGLDEFNAALESYRWLGLNYGATTLEFVERISALPFPWRGTLRTELPAVLPDPPVLSLLWKPGLLGGAGLLFWLSLRRRWRTSKRTS